MKRTTLAVGGLGLAAALLLSGAPAAQASAHHKAKVTAAVKAERKADRVAERRLEHQAAKATPTPAPSLPVSGAQGRSPVNHQAPAHKPKPATPCSVTADRDGSSFVVHNGCDTAQTITVSVQSQPGPWRVGLCQAGGCHLLNRHDVTAPVGISTVAAGSNACFYQVDLKWHGRLIRSNHFVTDCTPTPPTVKPHPPIIKPPVKTLAHRQPHARVRLTTATASVVPTLPRTGVNVFATVLLALTCVALGSLLLLTRHLGAHAQATRKALR